MYVQRFVGFSSTVNPKPEKGELLRGGLICAQTAMKAKRDANKNGREGKRFKQQKNSRNRRRKENLAELFESGESRGLLLGLPEEP